MSKIELIEGNLTIVMSDLHFGHEHCLYETLWYTIEKLLFDVELMKQRYTWKEVFVIYNGDVVSGTDIYRNQSLDNIINKDEAIVLFGSYMLHLIIEKIEKIVEQKVKVYLVRGNHEGSKKTLPQNFALAIARRLSSYGHHVRYPSDYLILNIAINLGLKYKDGSEKKYHLCAFHGYGGSDYSSVTPRLVRELTRFHSQMATDKNIIIHRFTVGHTHWLHTGKNVLGVRIDVTGGFQKWSMSMSWRETGLIYYIYTKNGVKVQEVSGLTKQLEESESQKMHTKIMRYTADIIDKAIDFEIDLGLLRMRTEEEVK